MSSLLGRRVEGRSGTTATVVESSPDRFVFERTLPPGTGRTQAHLHRDFVQTFEIVDGEGRMSVSREERRVGGGERVEIERGVAHGDPWNDAGGPMTFRMTIAPRPRFVEVYAASWATWLEQGRLNDQDEFTPLQLFAVLQSTRAESFAAGPPIWLQRPLVAVLGRVGRLRHRLVAPAGR